MSYGMYDDDSFNPSTQLITSKGNYGDVIIPGATNQGRNQLREETFLRADMPPISTIDINPRFSDASPDVLSIQDLRANERPETLIPAGGEIGLQEMPRDEMVPIPSRNLDEDILLEEMNRDNKPIKKTNPVIKTVKDKTFFDKICENKKIITAILLLVIMLILIFFLYLNK